MLFIIKDKKLFFLNQCFTQCFDCAVGKNGITTDKKEGDRATPRGIFTLKEVWYRSDRINEPHTSLPIKKITPKDGWCDAPHDKNYNRPVKLPYPSHHEKLWRQDHSYDLLAVINYNYDDPQPGLGSAIFMHVAKFGYPPTAAPTAGCITLRLEDLEYVLAHVLPESKLIIEE